MKSVVGIVLASALAATLASLSTAGSPDRIPPMGCAVSLDDCVIDKSAATASCIVRAWLNEAEQDVDPTEIVDVGTEFFPLSDKALPSGFRVRRGTRLASADYKPESISADGSTVVFETAEGDEFFVPQFASPASECVEIERALLSAETASVDLDPVGLAGVSGLPGIHRIPVRRVPTPTPTPVPAPGPGNPLAGFGCVALSYLPTELPGPTPTPASTPTATPRPTETPVVPTPVEPMPTPTPIPTVTPSPTPTPTPPAVSINIGCPEGGPFHGPCFEVQFIGGIFKGTISFGPSNGNFVVDDFGSLCVTQDGEAAQCVEGILPDLEFNQYEAQVEVSMTGTGTATFHMEASAGLTSFTTGPVQATGTRDFPGRYVSTSG